MVYFRRILEEGPSFLRLLWWLSCSWSWILLQPWQPEGGGQVLRGVDGGLAAQGLPEPGVPTQGYIFFYSVKLFSTPLFLSIISFHDKLYTLFQAQWGRNLGKMVIKIIKAFVLKFQTYWHCHTFGHFHTNFQCCTSGTAKHPFLTSCLWCG